MKKISALIVAAILILSACAPSEQSIQTAVAQTQASYTATPSPTSTPSPTATKIPTATPDLGTAFLNQYDRGLNQWIIQFQRVQNANQRIADTGATILKDDAFQTELANALSELQKAAKNFAAIKSPHQQLDILESYAKDLKFQTDTFATSYLLGLTGDKAASNTASAALDKIKIIIEDINVELTRYR